MRPQADVSVIRTLVTDLNTCSQSKPNFYFGKLSIVLGGVYHGINQRLHKQNIYLGKYKTPIPW